MHVKENDMKTPLRALVFHWQVDAQPREIDL